MWLKKEGRVSRKRVLVTGGSGFCGQALVKRLLEVGSEVVVLDLDDRNKPEGVEFVKGSVLNPGDVHEAVQGVESVYHCSGQLGTHELFASNQLAIDVNVKGTVNVLEAAMQAGCEKFMYPTKPYAWWNTYTVTKECGEKFVEMFHRVFGLEVAILRWLNVYGPGQKIGPVRKAIPLMCVQALEGWPIEVFGSGEAVVDLVYTEDMAKVTVDYTEWGGGDSQKRDVGCVVQMTVNEMAELIKVVSGSKSEIRHIEMRMGEDSNDPKEPLDSYSANQMLGVKYQTLPVRVGVNETLRYYDSISHEERVQWLGFFGCQHS
jgi:UDP-glucose 4-epimerase